MKREFEYESVLFAKYLSAYAKAHKYSLNITKIQKLLYIAYGTYLALIDKRLLDEHPQAWPYGPVFPKTRKCLVDIGIESFDQNDTIFDDIDKKNINGLLHLTFKTFGNYSAVTLSEWSHKKDSPWDRTVKSDNFRWGNVIDDALISEYFKSIIITKE